MLGSVLKHPISRTLLTEIYPIQKITQKYFKYDKNIFSTVLTVRTFLIRNTRLFDGLQSRLFKSNGLSQSLLVRRQQTLQLDVNTNVRNNVILYKYEKERYFRILHLFGVFQLLGWSLLTIYTYPSSFLDIFYSDINVKEYIKKNLIRFFIFTFSLFIGPLIYGTIYALCARSIKYIILNKGGKRVTITTYNPWKKKLVINIPIEMVKCAQHRTDARQYIPLKLQNRFFYYLLEKQGTFINPILFDNTIGFSKFRLVKNK